MLIAELKGERVTPALNADRVRQLTSNIATGEAVDEDAVLAAQQWLVVCLAFLRNTTRGDYQAALNRLIRAEEERQATR